MAIYQIIENNITTTFSKTGLKVREGIQFLFKHQIDIISPDTLVVIEEFGDGGESHGYIDKNLSS